MNWLIWGLSALENKPVGDTAIRDTLGNTVPKTALTRTKAERTDVAISQVGNTLAFVGGGSLVDSLLKQTFKNFQKAGAETVQKNWAMMARSLGIYSAMASSMWAMPFIRNYITTKRTGMVNYADVIKAGGAPKGPQTPEQKAAVEASLKESKKKALTILGAGAAGIILPAAIGYRGAQKEWAKKGLQKLFDKNVPLLKGKFKDKLLLDDGKFEKLGGLTSMLFWGIPAYIGWYHASRDPYEKKEVFVRCANFIACFSLPPILAKKAFASKFKQISGLGEMVNFKAIQEKFDNKLITGDAAKKARKLLVWQNLLGMGSSIVLLGVTPQVLNILLTKRRMKQEAAQKGQVAPSPAQANPVVTGGANTGNPLGGLAATVPSLAQFSLAQGDAIRNSSASLPWENPASPTRPQPFSGQNRYAPAWPMAGLGSPVGFR